MSLRDIKPFGVYLLVSGVMTSLLLYVMEIKVEKLTDLSLLQRANSFTTGRESKMDLAKAYRLGHSPIRTQIFWVEMRDIPLFCASQFVRSNVGVQFFQLSMRTDRGGEDFREVCAELAKEVELNCFLTESEQREAEGQIAENIRSLSERFDRYTPADLACVINAEAIINMSRKRLCAKASAETREIWEAVIEKVSECDPDLAKHCVKPCVHCGFCREAKPCGYMNTRIYEKQREDYLKLFE